MGSVAPAAARPFMNCRRVTPMTDGPRSDSLPTARWKFALPIAFCSGVISSAMTHLLRRYSRLTRAVQRRRLGVRGRRFRVGSLPKRANTKDQPVQPNPAAAARGGQGQEGEHFDDVLVDPEVMSF